ncbi:MAG TPA: ATP-binding protein [Flavobacteriaceae bacterium]|nr:ATP-binding protein [Flavobacteriaceae bacterium]
MKNTKKSITFKVVMGYVLVIILAVFAVWAVYDQIANITKANKIGNVNNQKLLLISEAVTNLYVAEGISRNIIQNENSELLPGFHAEIDTIISTIDSLKRLYEGEEMKSELDSISELLVLKEENLKELLTLRQEASTDRYYSQLMERLRPDSQLDNLGPEVRELLLRLENYRQSRGDSPENRNIEMTESVESLKNSLREIMDEWESEERQYQRTVSAKENELLENDRQLSSQLREIRTEIEREEIQKSFAQVAETQKKIEETSVLIAVIGGGSLLVILLFIILIIRDTNKSQQYREELEKSKNFAESLLKGREQLMATVTHDLRSPLNTISGYSDLLKKTNLDDKQAHYLDHLKKSSSYSLRLVNDLLDLSKLEVGKMTIEELPFVPKDLIEESLPRALPAEDPKQLFVSRKLSKNLEQQVVGDPFRIQQILTNLISNAYKFTEKGTIEISGELSPQTEKTAELSIRVGDTGIGISKKRQKIIFEEFTQAEDSIEKVYGGFGLGLAISKKMTNLLNGTIKVESEPGKGSVFTVSIPVKSSETKKLSVSTDEVDIHFKNSESFRILIIDDEESQLALTSEILKQAGFKYESSSNPKKALRKLRHEKFDLVLTDIQMPKMNGFQLIRNLKKSVKTAEIPVIALSGRTEVKESLYLEKGFKGSLTKPFSANKLLALIGKTLNLEKETVSPTFQKEQAQQFSDKSTTQKPYDLSDIETFAQNDRESIKGILSTFVESNSENLEVMQKSAREKNLGKLADTAHKMLPMFRQLKIESLISSLEILEKADKEILGEKHLDLIVDKTVDEARAILKKLKSEL